MAPFRTDSATRVVAAPGPAAAHVRATVSTVAAVCALAAGLAPGARELAGQSAPADRIVVLVRHAEKEAGDDPGLTAAGAARARTLIHVLAERPLGAVYVTEYRRTRDTGSPAAEAHGLEPIVVPARDLDGLARALRESTVATTLVVGHSNTVPALVAALGAPPVPEIPEPVYDDLFIVTLSGDGVAGVVHLKYGVPTPP